MKLRFMIVMGIVALAICLLFPLLPKSKFPYVGSWSYKWFGPDGKEAQVIFAFNPDGQCAVQRHYMMVKQEASCDYVMQGDSAIVTYKFKNVKLYDRMKVAALYTAVMIDKVTPKDNGVHLLRQDIQGTFTNQEDGSSFPRTHGGKVLMKRIESAPQPRFR